MALKFAVNNSLSAVTSLPTAISTGSMTLLQTQTASSSATIDFTSNIDSTYDSYVFKFIDLHPSVDDTTFGFETSTNGGTSYGVTKTSSAFYVRHNESDAAADMGYSTSIDLAQSTSKQNINGQIGADNDQSLAGQLQIFNPSSSTFVKHYISLTTTYQKDDFAFQYYIGGYCNTTSPINAIKFSMGSGNIDAGTIKMYGVA